MSAGMNPRRPIIQADLDMLDQSLVDEQLRYEEELRRRFRRRAQRWDLAISVFGSALAAFLIGYFVGRLLWGWS